MMRGSVSRFEHALGSGERAHRVPASPVVRSALAGDGGLVGYRHTQVGFSAWLEPPRPVVTLMIDLEGAITADGAPLPTAWIGGMGERPTVVGVGARYGAIDVKLTPLAAFTLLAGGLRELDGACVSLPDALGRPGAQLAARLVDATGWEARFDVLEAWLARRLDAGSRVDPAVARALARLHATAGRIRVDALAVELGCSRRHLTRRFTAQVGLPPKAVARQLRFAAVRRAIEAQPAGWADIALGAGYADQAHLSREFRELAGVTPTDFVARRMPEGGLVGDGLQGGPVRSRPRGRAGIGLGAHPHPRTEVTA